MVELVIAYANPAGADGRRPGSSGVSVAAITFWKEPSASSGWTRGQPAWCASRGLLDTGRPIRPAPGLWSLGGLIVLAAVAVPDLRLGGGDPGHSPSPRRRGSGQGRPRNSN